MTLGGGNSHHPERQHNDEPSCWSNESAGVICHENQVLEVYQVEIEKKVEESDHVKTNDETIKPDNVKKDDKNELKEAIRGSSRSPIARTSWLAVMLASAVAIGTTSAPGNEMALDATVWNFRQKRGPQSGDAMGALKLLYLIGSVQGLRIQTMTPVTNNEEISSDLCSDPKMDALIA